MNILRIRQYRLHRVNQMENTEKKFHWHNKLEGETENSQNDCVSLRRIHT